MLNLGPSGPQFAPYEGQKASKLGRSRNEGIPEILRAIIVHICRRQQPDCGDIDRGHLTLCRRRRAVVRRNALQNGRSASMKPQIHLDGASPLDLDLTIDLDPRSAALNTATGAASVTLI
jgi:hypothetical protein